MDSPASARVVSQPFFDVELRPDGIAWVRRKPVEFESVSDVHAAYDAFLATVDDWRLTRRIWSGNIGRVKKLRMAWLFDLRNGPKARNDPEFEAAIVGRRADLLKRSPIIGVLVKTAAGRMQLTRIARADATPMRIADDFDALVAWLQERMSEPTE